MNVECHAVMNVERHPVMNVERHAVMNVERHAAMNVERHVCCEGISLVHPQVQKTAFSRKIFLSSKLYQFTAMSTVTV